MSGIELTIDRVLTGDRAAFAVIVEGHRRLVYQIVSRMIVGETDREDLCQEVFVKVYQNLARFQGQAKFSTWVAKITCNTCLHFLEKKRPELYDDLSDGESTIEDHAADLPSPADFTQQRDMAIRISEEIDRLPVHLGIVVTLYHLHGMAYTEISEILGLPDGTVKSHLFRGRELLKKQILARFNREELCA